MLSIAGRSLGIGPGPPQPTDLFQPLDLVGLGRSHQLRLIVGIGIGETASRLGQDLGVSPTDPTSQQRRGGGFESVEMLGDPGQPPSLTVPAPGPVSDKTFQ